MAVRSKAQGLVLAPVNWPAKAAGYALLGNSVALCVLQRLLRRILCRWEILCGPDPWECGEAPDKMRKEVAQAEESGGDQGSASRRWHPSAAVLIGGWLTLDVHATYCHENKRRLRDGRFDRPSNPVRFRRHMGLRPQTKWHG